MTCGVPVFPLSHFLLEKEYEVQISIMNHRNQEITFRNVKSVTYSLEPVLDKILKLINTKFRIYKVTKRWLNPDCITIEMVNTKCKVHFCVNLTQINKDKLFVLLFQVDSLKRGTSMESDGYSWEHNLIPW